MLATPILHKDVQANQWQMSAVGDVAGMSGLVLINNSSTLCVSVFGSGVIGVVEYPISGIRVKPTDTVTVANMRFEDGQTLIIEVFIGTLGS